jgi:predicted methyltransferase
MVSAGIASNAAPKQKSLLVLGAILFSVGIAANAARKQPSSYIGNAVADPARPVEDKAQDVNRHPEDVVAFSGVIPGAKMVDLMPGSGYYTRIFSKAVGPRGKVYALQPEEMDRAVPKGLQSLHSFAGTKDYPNIVVLVQPVAALAIPESVDLVFTSMNYHDLHDPFLSSPDMTKFNRTIFAALKPGGIFLVLDHVAAADTGFTKTDDLHRVDPAAVKKEVTAAGFEFVGESNALSSAADDHSSSIYDKTIRGKTDRFIYKFRRRNTRN